MVSASDVRERLQSQLAATDVRVDDLAGCGTSFEVYVVSPAFAGKRVLERHKLINAALSQLMGDIHALSIKQAKTPDEVAAAADAAAAVVQ